METLAFIFGLIHLLTVFCTKVNGESVQHVGLAFANDHLETRSRREIAHRDFHDYVSDVVAKSVWFAPKKGSSQCKTHSDVVIQRAKELDIWALQILDSSAKIPSGIINGNLNQLGDFDQCLSATGRYGKDQIKGKYCLADVEIRIANSSHGEQILDNLLHSHRIFRNELSDLGHRIPKLETFNWGICIPDSCSSNDVEVAINQQLQDFSVGSTITLRAEVSDELCYVKDSKTFGWINYITLLIFTVVLIVTAWGTYADFKFRNESRLLNCLRCFSLKQNVTSLLSTESSSDDLGVLHGTRFFSALALLLSHKQMALMFNPFVNRTEMSEALGKSWSMMGRSAIIYTDSFVMMSGLLVSYSMIKELDKKKKINVKEKLISRFLRITPNLFAVIFFCTYIMEHLGSGPQWGLVVDRYANLCKQHMWRNFLYIHNYFGFENMCLTHTHQLGIDMQLFLISPLLIYFIWKYPRSGLPSLVIISIASTWLRYVVTLREGLSTMIHFGISVDRLWKTANLSYILPTHRATIYLMGVMLGYFLRRGGRQLQFSPLQTTIGWIFGGTAGVVAMLGPYHMSWKEYVYNPIDAALYNAFAPVLWGLFLTWLTVACVNGFGGWLNDLLSWKYFLIFTRIAYAVYLTQFPVFFYNVGTQRSAQYYKGVHTMIDFLELSAVVGSSVLLTLLFDMPFQRLKKELSTKSHTVVVKESPKTEPESLDATATLLEEKKEIVRARRRGHARG